MLLKNITFTKLQIPEDKVDGLNHGLGNFSFVVCHFVYL